MGIVGHDTHVTDDEVLVSVDIEASGPTPSTGSLISIGACLVDDESTAFYALIKPVPGMPWLERAERVHGLKLELCDENGLEPALAMTAFADWLESVANGRRPVFVGWNAGFDWMFVADYFDRFIGRNPFDVAPLDMKAYTMGRHRLTRWADTRRQALDTLYGAAEPLTHNALDDARQQATFIRRLLQQDDKNA
jgi:DNA polymerase III epsilon subunit-like protein